MCFEVGEALKVRACLLGVRRVCCVYWVCVCVLCVLGVCKVCCVCWLCVRCVWAVGNGVRRGVAGWVRHSRCMRVHMYVVCVGCDGMG